MFIVAFTVRMLPRWVENADFPVTPHMNHMNAEFSGRPTVSLEHCRLPREEPTSRKHRYDMHEFLS